MRPRGWRNAARGLGGDGGLGEIRGGSAETRRKEWSLKEIKRWGHRVRGYGSRHDNRAHNLSGPACKTLLG